MRGGLVHSRKGMSPLIATILLMAFAVALGGMIMNWSIDVSSNSDCADLSENINVITFCSTGGNLILKAQSSAKAPPLLGIELNIMTGNIENNVKVKNSELASGGDLALNIPLQVAEGATVDLLGVIGSPSSPYVCKENPIERVEPIKPC